MVRQYPDPDREQDEASGEFGSAAVRCREAAADPDPEGAERGGSHADDDGRAPDRDGQHGKTQTDGKGVNAGRNGKQHKRRAARGIFAHAGCAGMKGFPDHPDPDREKQDESEPVVKDGQHVMETDSQVPSNDGHRKLEKAEVKRHPEVPPKTYRLERRSRRETDCKGVHGQGNGQGQAGPDVKGAAQGAPSAADGFRARAR